MAQRTRLQAFGGLTDGPRRTHRTDGRHRTHRGAGRPWDLEALAELEGVLEEGAG